MSSFNSKDYKYMLFFFFSSRRRHTRYWRDWSSDVCSSDLLPHIDDFLDNGYTKEEMKMINETQKIFHDNNIKITATTARVPVFYGHSESINVELEKPFEIEDIFNLYKNAEGVSLKDDVKNSIYPLPLDAEGHDEVYVG